MANQAAPARQRRFPIRIAAGSVPQWAGAAWAVTAILMLLRLAISWVVLSCRKARATEAPPSLSARRDAWLVQCGSSRRVRIAVSAEIATPMVAGLRHPLILFPANLLDALNEAELDQVGLHEAAHVARGDGFALIVQRIVEALLALHPVVRWIARRIDLEREIACDDFVVQVIGKPRPYAACLTRVVELTGGVRGSVVAAAVADERSHLTRRVDMLLDKSRHTGTRTLKARLTAMVAVIASAVWVAAHAPGMIVFATPIAPVSASAAPAPIALPLPGASPGPPALLKPAPQALPRPSALLMSQTASEDVVTVPVGVRDPRNRYVTGLDKGDFRLFEDGVEQTIAQFRTSDEPLSVGLLVDTGSSMGAKLAQVNEAVRQFLKVANPRDEYFVVKFNEEAKLAIGFTSDRDEVQRQLTQMKPQGGTALFDAASLAMRQMQEAHNSRKAILVIAGAGSDNSSNNPGAPLLQEPKLIAEFVQGNVTVFALNIVEGNDPPAGLLAKLTAQTGGLYFTVGGDTAAMAQVSAHIGLELRNLYGLEYTPRNTAHDGAYRAVQIELIAHPGLPPLKLDYRPGYYQSRR
jgi:VWFA-related protein